MRVAWYRFGLRFKLHPVVRLKRSLGGTEFFRPFAQERVQLEVPVAWQDSALFFGTHTFPLEGGPPVWNRNPFNNQVAAGAQTPWWLLSDFDLTTGDVKIIWESSRFDWAVNMAQRAAAGDAAECCRLNAWLSDWCKMNPAFLGPNWKCGQEASFRVLHLALAARILGQDANPCTDLVQLLEAHLARIDLTTAYAVAQDNNHGTSEAAALFVGGLLCKAGGLEQGSHWSRAGRDLLENRVLKLIAPDGSFSQHSLNYHRLMLDTLSLAELWRQRENQPEFSPGFMERARAAAHWLHYLTDPGEGDVPNIGDNDGANLLPLTNADYRDFRPSVQLAMALFADQTAYSGDGSHETLLEWLQVKSPSCMAPAAQSRNFSDGGFSVLRRGRWTGVMKYPRYRFRPRHCDALHLDLWHGSENILRDAGSFSYNAEAPWQDYFPGTKAHNTIEFDDHDQMPALGRFLRGAWLKTNNWKFNANDSTQTSFAAGYIDWQGASHHRQVMIDRNMVLVEDLVGGFSRCAVLRWRLQPGHWTLSDELVRGNGFLLSIRANVKISRIELVEGWESRYYLKKSKILVLEVELQKPGTIFTEIQREKSP